MTNLEASNKRVNNFGTNFMVEIPLEFSADTNIRCQNPQVGIKVTFVPNIDCPVTNDMEHSRTFK